MSRRLAVLVLAALAAVGLVVAGPSAGSSARTGPPVSLRVLNFNIHTGIGADGRLDLARTAAVIEDSGADVVGLQEVDVHWAARSAFADQATELAELLDMRLFFAPIYDLPPLTEGAPRRQYGVAVLSRYPIVHTENHWITRLSTQDPNPVPAPAPGFAEAVIQAHGARLHVYVTHLDYRADPSVRVAQVTDTLRILDEDPRAATQLLLGDFNAEPSAPELDPLWNGLVDAWSVAGDGPGLTYPAGVPVKRIDYVTTSSGATVRQASVPDVLASDHRPVLVELEVSRGRG